MKSSRACTTGCEEPSIVRVTVFGSAQLHGDHHAYKEAARLGRALAELGHVIVSGGYGGLMEAVSRGAHEVGGSVVGVTVQPWAGRLVPNPYLSEEIPSAT